MKLTDKPLSFGYSVVDSHSSCRPVKAKTRRSGFYEEVKLTDKPLSFGYSVVDS
ncbi:lipoprotein, partial [Salmonella enterica subsp. enterica serovar Bareilly str. CFSAN000755]